MPNKTKPYHIIQTDKKLADTFELSEHGLQNATNHDFNKALYDLLDILKAECLIRECHGIYGRLLDLQTYIRSDHTQDYFPVLYPSVLHQVVNE